MGSFAQGQLLYYHSTVRWLTECRLIKALINHLWLSRDEIGRIRNGVEGLLHFIVVDAITQRLTLKDYTHIFMKTALLNDNIEIAEMQCAITTYSRVSTN